MYRVTFSQLCLILCFLGKQCSHYASEGKQIQSWQESVCSWENFEQEAEEKTWADCWQEEEERGQLTWSYWVCYCISFLTSQDSGFTNESHHKWQEGRKHLKLGEENNFDAKISKYAFNESFIYKFHLNSNHVFPHSFTLVYSRHWIFIP